MYVGGGGFVPLIVAVVGDAETGLVIFLLTSYLLKLSKYSTINCLNLASDGLRYSTFVEQYSGVHKSCTMVKVWCKVAVLTACAKYHHVLNTLSPQRTWHLVHTVKPLLKLEACLFKQLFWLPPGWKFYLFALEELNLIQFKSRQSLSLALRFDSHPS